MTGKTSFSRFAVLSMLGVLLMSGISCMTTYDHQGRPVQSVDPGAAAAGAVAAGVLGYAIANNRGDRHHHHHAYNRPHYGHRGGYYRAHRHRGGYYRR